jgi:hypothetical protein
MSLENTPSHILPTPDGSCIIIADIHEGMSRLRCLHWTSFGGSEGTNLILSANISPSMAVSALGRPENMHLFMLDAEQQICYSKRITITKKSSSYAFRRHVTGSEHRKTQVTTNNALIDCHAEVWTKFPIHAPISREPSSKSFRHPSTITFVSHLSNPPFERYFRNMVFEFDRKIRKPTDGKLRNIQINHLQDWPPSAETFETSTFVLGDWLVGLFCLIPIHLAITSFNRFLPLKDGITSGAFEEEVLGADVLRIAQA